MLMALCLKMGKHQYCLEGSRTAVLARIDKRGSRTDHARYIPVFFQSYCTKVIEASIASTIRKLYSFHNIELEFQKGTRTETAMINQSRVKRQTYEVFNRIRSEISVRQCFERQNRVSSLSEDADTLGNYDCHDITANENKNKKQILTTENAIERVLPKVSNLRPALFKVYVDTLAELL